MLHQMPTGVVDAIFQSKMIIAGPTMGAVQIYFWSVSSSVAPPQREYSPLEREVGTHMIGMTEDFRLSIAGPIDEFGSRMRSAMDFNPFAKAKDMIFAPSARLPPPRQRMRSRSTRCMSLMTCITSENKVCGFMPIRTPTKLFPRAPSIEVEHPCF